ncbi:MAG: hypothetical protein FJ280_04120 [Planctomycetes bacterium]|nr:hypothetical protein [Planctomycetota bacterium]
MHRRSKRILTVLGVIIVAFAALYAIAVVRATTRLRRAYAALGADGRPLRAAEIIPPEVPDAQNAAVLYQSAALMLKGQAAGEKDLLQRLDDLSAALSQKPVHPDRIARQQENIAELRQRMSLPIVASALATVEQGTQRPACQFQREYAGALSVDAPFRRNVRNLIRILGARVHLYAEAGETAQAWSTLQTQLKFANALRDDPTTMSQLMRSGMISYSCRLIQSLCENEPPEVQLSRSLEDLLRDMTGIEPFIRAVDGERLLIGEWFFNLPRDEMDKAWRQDMFHPSGALPGAIEEALHRLGFRILAFRPRLVADHAAYLEVMRKRVQLLQGPYRSAQECRDYLNVSKWHFLTHLFAVGGEKWVHCRMAANVQVTRAGLALLRYRQAHGAFPPTLEALDLDGLLDPYTGKPLLYRPEGEGFVVYSVDEDLKDNGGVPKPEKQDSDPRRRKPLEGDRVWRFPSAENRIGAGGNP